MDPSVFPPRQRLGGFSPMHGSLSSFLVYPLGLGNQAHLSVFPPGHRPGGFFYLHLDLSIFLHQSPRELEVFYQLTHWFSSTISR